MCDNDSFDDLLEVLPGTKQDIKGLGNKAIFQPEFGTLFVLSGDTRIVLSYAGPPRSTLEADERALMMKILPHL